MAELLMTTRAAEEAEKLGARRGHVLLPRGLLAAGDQFVAKDCVGQIGLAA